MPWKMSITRVDRGNYQNSIGLKERKLETSLGLPQERKRNMQKALYASIDNTDIDTSN